MGNVLILSVILALTAAVGAQDEFVYPAAADYPEIVHTGKSVESFVPDGWKIAARSDGDLNADGTADAAVYLKGAFAKFLNKNKGLGVEEFDTNPRILLILFAKNGNYELASRSDTFIFIPDSPVVAEPFKAMSIAKGVLRIDFELWQSAGSWGATTASYKFRYRNGEFLLIGADKEDSMRNTGRTELRSYNFLTKTVKIATGNFESDAKPKVRWRTLKSGKLKTLKTFPKPFEWEVEPDYYL